MIRFRIIAHRVRQPPLRLQKMIGLALELRNAVFFEEGGRDTAGCRLPCDSLDAILAELK